MSMVEIEQTIRDLSAAEQSRLMGLLVAERAKREGESLPQKAARLETEDNWVAWDEVKKDLTIGPEELAQ